MQDASPQLDYWFDFASSYSYLTTMRIEAAAARAGVCVTWRPFLLGPIFVDQGWSTSPFRIYAAKGAYMTRDIERRAQAAGLPFQICYFFPVNSVQAARLAIAALERPEGPAFCRAVATAAFGEGRDIAEPAALTACAEAAGLDPAALAARAAEPEMKPVLRANTAEARAAGVFGAPSFIARGELFWGDDQLENAFAWAREGRLTAPYDRPLDRPLA